MYKGVVITMRKITDKIIRKFKNHLIDEEKSKATLEKYIRDIYTFVDWLEHSQPCKSKVLEYKEHLMNNYAPASVNSIISSLNSFFEYIGEHSLKIKTLKIQRRIFIRKERELSKKEYERLLSAAKLKGNYKLFLIMQTICAIGIRVSELQFITVEAVKRGQAVINLKGKMRMIILPHDLCRILKKYCANQKISSGSIFITKNGKPLDRTSIWKLMKSLCEDANVDKEKVFPHNLRHLFARTYYSLEKDIARLADILGHSSVDTTRIYTMESGDIHRRQIQRLGLLRC